MTPRQIRKFPTLNKSEVEVFSVGPLNLIQARVHLLQTRHEHPENLSHVFLQRTNKLADIVIFKQTQGGLASTALYDFEFYPARFNFLDLKRSSVAMGAVRHVAHS
jgi:hypothetical protein